MIKRIMDDVFATSFYQGFWDVSKLLYQFRMTKEAFENINEGRYVFVRLLVAICVFFLNSVLVVLFGVITFLLSFVMTAYIFFRIINDTIKGWF